MTPRALADVIAPFRAAMRDATKASARDAARAVFAADATLNLCHPFGTLSGPDALIDVAYGPLIAALPDLERRDMIVMAGPTPEGRHWVATMGNLMGTFLAPFLGIRPTGHLVHMRYHEFFEVEDGKITGMQAIWDIPELMMQAGVWPMAPQLGAFLCTPAPAPGDGLAPHGDGRAAVDHVLAMLGDMCRHPAEGGPEVMNLARYWHPRFNWYGPAGIGTARGIAGFRHWHQIPFLKAMPDRKLDAMGDLMSHWIGQGSYVAETGWPNMRLTLSGDGWLGLPPVNREVMLRSLDFWRLENGLIRENWVLVDLLDLYRQVGVDVFARLGAFNTARSLHPIDLPDGLTA